MQGTLAIEWMQALPLSGLELQQKHLLPPSPLLRLLLHLLLPVIVALVVGLCLAEGQSYE